jgi:minimal PKS ketosynthase (KS/KS alpha)
MGLGIRRVAITGLGVLAPGGVDAKQFWDLLTSGRSAAGPIRQFDASGCRSRIAAECDFDPVRTGLTAEQAASWDRMTQMAVVAADQAFSDTGGASAVDPERTGVCIGTAVGMTRSLQREFAVIADRGQPSAACGGRQLYDYFVPSSVVRDIAWRIGAEGPAAVVSTACASGVDAVAHANSISTCSKHWSDRASRR